MKSISFIIIRLLTGIVNRSIAQSLNDFQTKRKGEWSDTICWIKYDSIKWVDAHSSPSPLLVFSPTRKPE